MFLGILLATMIPTFADAAITINYVDVPIDDSLNIRKSPKATAAIITNLEAGTEVNVYSKTKGWAKISVNGIEGYVNSSYLSSEKISPASNSSYKVKAISVAKQYLGTRYRWGGITPKGFDCSGLVKYSYAKAGKTLPRTAAAMYKKGSSVNTLKAGDLMFFAPNRASKPTHVSIYIGGGQMIQSATSKGVSIASISNSYWKPKYIGAKRI